MPQIQEYTPQTQAQEPVGSASPNVELAGAVGRALQSGGNAIAQSGRILREREAQEETADVYSAIQDQRSYFTNKINQQTQEGSLDPDQIQEEFENETSKIGDNLNTAQGKNYFTRQQARLKSTLTQHAAFGMAQVAKAKAQANWQQSIGATSSALVSDPTQFEDSRQGAIDHIDELVKTGGLPESMRDKAINEMSAKFADATIGGWAQLNPDHAQQMVNRGDFDQYLNGDQKLAALAKIEHFKSAKLIEQNRAEKAIQDAKQKVYDKWGNDHFESLTNNALSTNDVIKAVNSGVMDWDQGVKWNRMIAEGAKTEQKGDPRVFNDLIRRVVDQDSENPINKIDDAMPYVGRGITVQQLGQIQRTLSMRSDIKTLNAGQKTLFSSARSTIRFKNMLTQQFDPAGETKLSQFYSDFNDAVQKARDDGDDPNELTNPNSPKYFGNRLPLYQTSMKDQMSTISKERTDKALGLKPTGNNPNPTPVKGARRPGESAADYLKRTGLGG